MRQITSKHVWDAYHSLYNYIKQTQKHSRIPIPKRFEDSIPTQMLPDLEILRDMISKQDQNYIIQCDELYYCYLFLFVQTIRCSLKDGPYFNSPETGWENLSWFPLASLRGREGVAERSWYGWYCSHIQNKSTTEKELSTQYPLLDKKEVYIVDRLKSQMKIVDALAEKRGTTRADIVANYKYDGCYIENKGVYVWHVWIPLCLPELWAVPHDHVKQGLYDILKDRSVWPTFLQVLNAMHPKDHKAKLVLKSRIDSCITYSSPLEYKKPWRDLGKKILKLTNE